MVRLNYGGLMMFNIGELLNLRKKKKMATLVMVLVKKEGNVSCSELHQYTSGHKSQA